MPNFDLGWHVIVADVKIPLLKKKYKGYLLQTNSILTFVLFKTNEILKNIWQSLSSQIQTLVQIWFWYFKFVGNPQISVF
jgi:hypothetical protein